MPFIEKSLHRAPVVPVRPVGTGFEDHLVRDRVMPNTLEAVVAGVEGNAGLRQHAAELLLEEE